MELLEIFRTFDNPKADDVEWSGADWFVVANLLVGRVGTPELVRDWGRRFFLVD
jgi:hypothetical protein